MKIKVELYGASKDFSPENTIDLDLKSNSRIKDLRKELIKFINIKHNGNKNFCQIVTSSAFCSEDDKVASGLNTTYEVCVPVSRTKRRRPRAPVR